MEAPSVDLRPEPTAGFSDAAAARLREAQAAMTDLLAGVGLDGARAIDVGRRLGLDKTLAWKVARFIEGSDSSEAARHMPGAGGVELVLRAAAAHGVDAARIEAVREADRRLREFVGRHAGDRRSFEAMLAGGDGGGPDERLVQEERRAYYRAGSAIWGVRARVQFLMLALRPAASGGGGEGVDGMLDLVQIGGLVDFERLRADVPWIVRRLRASTTDDERSHVQVRREPLDAEGAAMGSVLVPEFCSRPAPALRQFQGANGWVYDELVPGPVGRRGAVTCVTGEILRAALPYRHAPGNTRGVYSLTVRTPVESVIFDVLVHRSLTHFGPASASVVGLLEDRPSSVVGAAPPGGSAVRGGGLLGGPSEAQRLGAPPLMQTPRLASYPAMVAGALRRAGWASGGGGGGGAAAADEFVGYRMELEYPAAPCDLVLTCPIGEGG